MAGTVTPKAVYNRKGFEMLRTESEERFSESKSGVYNEVEGYNGNPRFLVEPLEVMF